MSAAILANSRSFPYPKYMEVTFTPEQEAKITRMATQSGKPPASLVADVVVRYLDDKARFIEGVERGQAAAARGEFIEEEEMDARLEAMFKV